MPLSRRSFMMLPLAASAAPLQLIPIAGAEKGV